MGPACPWKESGSWSKGVTGEDSAEGTRFQRVEWNSISHRNNGKFVLRGKKYTCDHTAIFKWKVRTAKREGMWAILLVLSPLQ